MFDEWKKEDGLLDVRGQMQQVCDLRYAGAGHVPEAGKFGVVGATPSLTSPASGR